MDNQGINDYIKQNRATGINDYDIKQNLINSGWQSKDVEQAFATLEQTNAPSPVPATPTGKGVGWKTVLSSVIGILVITIPVVINRLDKISSQKYADVANEASRLVVQEKYPEALVSAQKLLSVSKSNKEKAEAQALLALVYIKLDKMDEAEVHANESKILDPSYEKLNDIFATLYLIKAKNFFTERKYEQVIDPANKALNYLQTDEQKGYAHYLLSVALLNLNQPDKALTEEQTATQLATSTIALIYNDSLAKAKSVWSDGKYDEMFAPANKALSYARSDEEKGYAHYWLGVAYFKLNQLDQAEGEEKLAIQLVPKSAGPNVTMAAIYMNRGNPQKALEYSQKAVELEPNYAWAHNSLGLSLADLGRKDEAIKELEKAVQLDPDTSLFRLNLTRVKGQ